MIFRMDRFGLAFFATRGKGLEVRQSIEQAMRDVPPGESLVIDFTGIEDITFSFADECIAKMMASKAAGDYPDRGIVLSGLNDEIREALDVVLTRRDLAMVAIDRGASVLGVDSFLSETLSLALDLGSFTASDIAERLGLSVQAANNRLKHLTASGAVVRHLMVPEGGGREYQYKTVVPIEA